MGSARDLCDGFVGGDFGIASTIETEWLTETTGGLGSDQFRTPTRKPDVSGQALTEEIL